MLLSLLLLQFLRDVSIRFEKSFSILFLVADLYRKQTGLCEKQCSNYILFVTIFDKIYLCVYRSRYFPMNVSSRTFVNRFVNTKHNSIRRTTQSVQTKTQKYFFVLIKCNNILSQHDDKLIVLSDLMSTYLFQVLTSSSLQVFLINTILMFSIHM